VTYRVASCNSEAAAALWSSRWWRCRRRGCTRTAFPRGASKSNATTTQTRTPRRRRTTPPCWSREWFGTYTAPQDAYAASSTLCVPDRASVQSRPQPKPVRTDFGLQP